MVKIRGFEHVSPEYLKSYDTTKDVILPLCKTKRSSGYDFFAPYNFMLGAGERKIIWTDVRSYMQDDEELLIFIRSSIGIKLGIVLSNSVGKIDSDYYGNKKNDGNIGISLYNTTNVLLEFERGIGLAQGTFYKFLKSDNCNGSLTRSGGMGSTD